MRELAQLELTVSKLKVVVVVAVSWAAQTSLFSRRSRCCCFSVRWPASSPTNGTNENRKRAAAVGFPSANWAAPVAPTSLFN